MQNIVILARDEAKHILRKVINQVQYMSLKTYIQTSEYTNWVNGRPFLLYIQHSARSTGTTVATTAQRGLPSKELHRPEIASTANYTCFMYV